MKLKKLNSRCFRGNYYLGNFDIKNQTHAITFTFFVHFQRTHKNDMISVNLNYSSDIFLAKKVSQISSFFKDALLKKNIFFSLLPMTADYEQKCYLLHTDTKFAIYFVQVKKMHIKITPRRKVKWFFNIAFFFSKYQQKPVQHFMCCLLQKKSSAYRQGLIQRIKQAKPYKKTLIG